MTKIYNEVVIDMNPESPTFEETLYEDSFEYSGDMMLFKWKEDYSPLKTDSAGNKYELRRNVGYSGKGAKEWQIYVTIKGSTDRQLYHKSNYNYDVTQGVVNAANKVISDKTGSQASSIDFSTSGFDPDDPTQTSKAAKGAEDITKDMFVNEDGSLKSVDKIYEVLDPLLPGITGAPLKSQINDMLPRYKQAEREEQGFVAEQYGGTVQDDPSTPDVDESKETSFAESISGREAGAVKEADMYGLQKEANKVGAQVYGGMGAGLRGAIIGQASIKKGFEATQDKYGLAKDKADLASRTGMYHIEKGAGDAYETEVSDWLEDSWFDNPLEAREGGRVPDKESFSQFLIQLPEAGGS